MTTTTMVDLKDDDQAVLDVLRREYRVNPMRIRNQTDLEKGDVNTALNRLARDGLVRQVERGLYEYTGDDLDPELIERVEALAPDA